MYRNSILAINNRALPFSATDLHFLFCFSKKLCKSKPVSNMQIASSNISHLFPPAPEMTPSTEGESLMNWLFITLNNLS